MDIIDNLTNEEISKKFGNQFDLVNYAIGLATNMIQTGREPRVKLNTENPALLILEEIAEGKDKYAEPAAAKETTEVEEMKIEVEDLEEEDEDASEDEELLEEEEETQEVLSD